MVDYDIYKTKTKYQLPGSEWMSSTVSSPLVYDCLATESFFNRREVSLWSLNVFFFIQSNLCFTQATKEMYMPSFVYCICSHDSYSYKLSKKIGLVHASIIQHGKSG